MTTNQKTGKFEWRELMTHDAEGSKRFYSEVFGWTIKEPKEMPNYQEFNTSTRAVAGMLVMGPEMKEVPTCWIQYVTVPDVDAAAQTAKNLGANIVAGPQDIPNVGRFATVIDPQGAAFSLFKFSVDVPEPPAQPSVGEFCWEQLNATDLQAARDFYTKVVGWAVSEFQGMTTFKAGDASVASIMQAPPGVPSHWLTYVVVDSLSSARERVKKAGGTVLVEQIPVPTVGTFAVIQDPQGAVICMFEGEKKLRPRRQGIVVCI